MSTDGKYEFEGVTYTYDMLPEMTVLELKDLFNEISDQLGLTRVPRFTDRQNGAVRVWARLKEYDGRLTKWPDDRAVGTAWTPPPRAEEELEENPVAVIETTAPPVSEETPKDATAGVSSNPRKKRQKYFNFPPLAEIKQPRAGTLRDRVLSQLTVRGLTFEEVVVLVQDFDTDRKSEGKDLHGSDEHAERRAYEILRIIHYVLGYGMRHDVETGLIKVFTQK